MKQFSKASPAIVLALLAALCCAGCDEGVEKIECIHLRTVGEGFMAMGADELPNFSAARPYPGAVTPGDGMFNSFAASLEIDGRGNVYIADAARVQMFDSRGRFVKAFAPEESYRELDAAALYRRYFADKEADDALYYNRLYWFDDDTLLIQSYLPEEADSKFGTAFLLTDGEFGDVREFKPRLPRTAGFSEILRHAATGKRYASWVKFLGNTPFGESEKWLAELNEDGSLGEEHYLGKELNVLYLLEDGKFFATAGAEAFGAPAYAVIDSTCKVLARYGGREGFFDEVLGMHGGCVMLSPSQKDGEPAVIKVLDSSLTDVARIILPPPYDTWEPLIVKIGGSEMAVMFQKPDSSILSCEVFAIETVEGVWSSE